MAEEEEKIEPMLTPIDYIRRHSQFLIVLTFCLFLGWYTFALFLIAWITGARWAENEGYLEKYKMDLVWGRSFLMWRTDWGKNFIEKISQNKPFWRRVGDVWVVTVFLIMIFMFLLLLWQATLAWQIPKSSSVSPKMMIGLPGLNPIIPLWYGILALVIAMVVHEFSHGILSRVANVRIKALGLLMFFFPVGAFVEPDEEEMRSMKKWERMRLYAAGPGSNMVIAIIFSFLFSSVMVASLEPSSEGVLSASVVVDYGGEEAGLEPWMLITDVGNSSGNQPIRSSEDFSIVMNSTYAGQVVNVSVLNKGNPETYQVTLSDKGSYYLKYYPDSYETWMSGKGFMGIAVVEPELVVDSLSNPGSSGGSMLQYITLPFQKLQPFPEHFTALFSPTGLVGVIPDSAFWILANSFYWIFWLNLMVGLTNALPAVPLDGGFIFADGVTGLLGKVRSSMTAERKEEIVDRLVSILAITVLFLIVWQIVGPRMVGTEPVTLNADIDTSNLNGEDTKGWSGDVFQFDASGSEGAFVTYEWDFGDGNTATGEKVEHNWSQGGLYFVVLTAKDAEDRQSVAFQEISIDHEENGNGEVAGGGQESILSTINPYVENVTIYINLTGESTLPNQFEEQVTVTITPPSGVVFEQSVSLGAQTEYIKYTTNEGEMVGDWVILLESDSIDSAFSYNYNWVTYFQDNS